MKIGVFGDSFADSKTHKDIWWKYLANNYQHDIECFGEHGSSLVFSARQIVDRCKQYDLVIWCVTSSNRLTIWHRKNFKEIAVHITGRHHKIYPDPEVQEKINIAEQYLMQVFDWPDGEFVGKSILDSIKLKVPNLLIVPSFATPVYDDISNSGFNLHDLCVRETSTYFSKNCVLAEIYDEYNDNRAGHFTATTHQTLADLISKSLTPGIFSADYNKFAPPVEEFTEVFTKLQ